MCVFRSIISSIKTQEMKGREGGGGGVAGGDKQASQSKPIDARKRVSFPVQLCKVSPPNSACVCVYEESCTHILSMWHESQHVGHALTF
jgi:hypothetical protein